MSIVFLGGGNMASAMIGGLINHGQDISDIKAVEIDTATAQALTSRWNLKVYTSLAPALEGASTLILAVKPQQLPEALSGLPKCDPSLRVISIAAGISTTTLSNLLQGHRNIVRVMPNTPALIQEGVTALYAVPEVNEEDRLNAQSLMRSVGSTLWLDNEEQMDAVTAVSGSGPAYVFLLIEAMMAAAEKQGLKAELARSLVLDTVKGAAMLAAQSTDTPATLRQRVTSRGGTTEAAIGVLEQKGFRQNFVEAIQAATERSRELGRGAK